MRERLGIFILYIFFLNNFWYSNSIDIQGSLKIRRLILPLAITSVPALFYPWHKFSTETSRWILLFTGGKIAWIPGTFVIKSEYEIWERLGILILYMFTFLWIWGEVFRPPVCCPWLWGWIHSTDSTSTTSRKDRRYQEIIVNFHGFSTIFRYFQTVQLKWTPSASAS